MADRHLFPLLFRPFFRCFFPGFACFFSIFLSLTDNLIRFLNPFLDSIRKGLYERFDQFLCENHRHSHRVEHEAVGIFPGVLHQPGKRNCELQKFLLLAELVILKLI